ncbi:MAG: polyprenyl synthetase family protein [Acidobacteriota bacterium]
MLKEIYKLIQDDLDKVERKFYEYTNSPIGLVSDIGRYIFRSGGKRIRPALMIFSSKLFSYKGEDLIDFASAVEFIHTASIVHDDIVDNSKLRRGRESIHTTWGPNITVLLGDFFYITSIKLIVKKENMEVIKVLSETTANMVEGELWEISKIGDINLNEEEYLEIIKKKTADLFSASCSVGAILSGANEDEIKTLAEYGMNIGMIFQLTDDLLDFISDEKALGKPVLSDLMEGKITLPLIYLLKQEKEINFYKIKAALKDKNFNKSFKDDIVSMIKNEGADEYVKNVARKFSQSAKKNLDIFSDSSYKQALFNLPDIILNRKK